jgi:asparagine synthase (glutamine-hydrolysing)
MSYWLNPEKVVVGGSDSWAVRAHSSADTNSASFANQMMLTDTLNYLTDDILVKVDRASMAVSLEVRAPLLDHRILEFAWRLPFQYKMRGTQGKIVLRDVLQRYVPKELFDRPKVGFGVPLNEWLRGPLRDWAEGLLDERRLRAEGYFHPKPIRAVWTAHLAGHGDWGYRLWGVLMFQAWLERQAVSAQGTMQLAKC